MQSMTIDSAAIRLTDTILGHDEPDLEQALKAIAANIGVLHIAYVPLCSQKSEDANLLSAICTYPFAWQERYFKKQYARIDPVIARGSEAVLPFDWDELPRDDPAARAFFDDAVDHDVGRNGLSIPVRNRKGVRSLVSFTSNHSKDDWAEDIQAFETEGLIGAGVAPAVLAYLFHRIGDRLDGRPTLLIIDEGWLALDDPGFAGQLREWLKTLRKKECERHLRYPRIPAMSW